jgi:hypothetical protein
MRSFTATIDGMLPDLRPGRVESMTECLTESLAALRPGSKRRAAILEQLAYLRGVSERAAASTAGDEDAAA